MKTKRLMSTILVFAIAGQSALLTSCSKNVNAEDNIVQTTKKTEIQNTQWDYALTDYNVNLKYEPLDVKPNVAPYSVKADLSDVFNISEYTGFTDEQKKLLSERGFIITAPSYNSLKMHQNYEMLSYDKTPIFITTDIMLYMYHVFYNNSLLSLEASSLNDELYVLTREVYKKSLEYYKDDKYSDLKEELKYVAAYFLTASKLMDISLSANEIPAEINELANKEIEFINKADDFTTSPIFGHEIDYSQYTVRGHYTADEKLEKYFKTMMWYGNNGFPILKEDGNLDTDNTTKAMIITSIMFNDKEILNYWDNIYSVTSMYSGNSDDLNIINYRDLISNVYGANPDINIFKDSSYYDKILEEVKKLPEPQIVAKLTTVDTPVTKQFRFMGQRYTFDGEIMQELMEPIERPIPSGLDVIAAFGNERAEELLDSYYQPKEKWSGYEQKLYTLKENNNNISEDIWKSNLYSGWLWSIKSAATSFENIDGMPMFMKNKYWTYKNINTALGSYAELKHDNVLYSKQPVAERGGLDEYKLPYHYVEPNVEVYSKLLWLTKNTKENLNVRNLLDEQTVQILDKMIDILNLMLNVSVKELNGEIVTREEFNEISDIGGLIDYLEMGLNMAIAEKIEKPLDNYTSALISDVATIAPNNMVPYGSYLELGTGLPHDIYVLCNQNGKTFLAKGTVYNYYEFLSDERLTNEKWYELLGMEIGDYIMMKEPSVDLPAKPEWTDLIISKDKNKIEVNYMGLNWDE